MKLYQSMASPFAARVRLMIYLKGIDIEFVTGDWVADFKERAPTKKIPTLELDDGTMIPESEVICEYLEEHFKTPSALPDAPLDRVKARLIARYFDLYIVGAITPLAEAMGAGVKVPQETLDKLLGELSLWLQRIDDLMGPGPYAVGDRVSYADGVVLPLIWQMRLWKQLTGLAIPLDELPRLSGYVDAVSDADPIAAKIAGEIGEAYAQAKEMTTAMAEKWKAANS